MKVSELEGVELDRWVAKAEGWNLGVTNVSRLGQPLIKHETRGYVAFSPSTDWSQGGPIIERERIHLSPRYMEASLHRKGEQWWVGHIPENRAQIDPTPLIAAMRAFVASKFGEEV